MKKPYVSALTQQQTEALPDIKGVTWIQIQ